MANNNTPIIKLRNLGPACERDLNAVGIFTLGDIKKHGVEKTFELMLRGRIARCEGGSCFNAAYLYALYGAVHDMDWRELPIATKTRFKKLTAQLRETID